MSHFYATIRGNRGMATRQGTNRFAADELDEKHGPYGWQEVEMPT